MSISRLNDSQYEKINVTHKADDSLFSGCESWKSVNSNDSSHSCSSKVSAVAVRCLEVLLFFKLGESARYTKDWCAGIPDDSSGSLLLELISVYHVTITHWLPAYNVVVRTVSSILLQSSACCLWVLTGGSILNRWGVSCKTTRF